MSNDFDLASIRLGTQYDLADAMGLASRFLASADALDRVSAQFSHELLVAVSLHLAYEQKGRTLNDVVYFISDPAWDDAQQMLSYFAHCDNAFRQEAAAEWRKGFLTKSQHMTSTKAELLLGRCRRQWASGDKSARVGGERKRKPRGSVLVFKPEPLAKAAEVFATLKEEQRGVGEVLLQGAHANAGYRKVPNAKRAMKNLEAAKARFENLVEPIDCLQTYLVLAAAMNPQEFHVRPILLLGEPGIGKTFLATQLAAALGVSMEKISAGGTQGAFQLTGSHPSWKSARPGMLFSLLAEGTSAAPVVVIDEVDKIHDGQYAVMPALLDMLDKGTAQHFKDEYFEMTFDVSRIIFVLTANSIEGIPAPLLSRVEVFDVPPPAPAQRLRIIQEAVEQLCVKTKTRMTLDVDSSETLSLRMDIDLRGVGRAVDKAFAMAIHAGDKEVRIAIPAPAGRRGIGFHTASSGSTCH